MCLLREQAEPVVSLVAEEGGSIIGHIMFSLVTLPEHSGRKVMGLAPMAVRPEHQRRGVGTSLVRAGLKACKKLGFGAVVVLGHPEYYPRFGFSPAHRLNKLQAIHRDRENVRMADTGFKRVSRKWPCRVCGKPDWCSMTTTETISFCARSTLNADRISRYGWGVYHHDGSRSGFDTNFERNFNRFPNRKKIEISKALAPSATRDTVYRKLIELSPASSSREIVNNRGGLLERGIQDLSLYGNLPRLVNERQILVERIVEELAEERVHSFEGIPGFWRDSRGRRRLWSEQDSFDDLMLIPFVGPDGLIRACQIRFMRYIPNKSGRYVWLSSSKERSGCGPGATLHHADPFSRSDKTVLITEGALKAATAQMHLPDRYVVGNSGAAPSHREIIETARNQPLEIAFDNDSFNNPHVARALASLLQLRLADQRSLDYEDEVRVLTWDRRIKGIDEALLLGHQLSSLTVPEWLKDLSPECLDQAVRVRPV